MARKNTDEQLGPEGLAALLCKNLGGRTYTLGEHRLHTYGVVMPLAMQWLIGGSNVFPMQRVLSLSGEAKSFKSTLGIEIGIWHVQQGGAFFAIDTESKTSASMLEAMSWWRLSPQMARGIVFHEATTTEDWMNTVTEVVKVAKAQYALMPEKGSRMPIFVNVDSLTGKTSEDDQKSIMDEGHAAARGFPTRAAQITRYLESFDLCDTTMSLGYVRHLKTSIDGASKPGMPPQQRETGGAAANFKCTLSIRVKKLGPVACAEHAALPEKGPTVQGYTLQLESTLSCLGPDKRRLAVDVVWQYKDCEDGMSRQIMAYDWAGALGQLLFNYKYDEKFKSQEGVYANDKERLDQALKFSQAGHKKINCAELELEGADFTTFGQAIERNLEVSDRVSRFLNITKYSPIQVAELTQPVVKKKD